ncbi:MAG: hypothetical protein AB7K52_00240 [Phycisphaerales bacterium]
MAPRTRRTRALAWSDDPRRTLRQSVAWVVVAIVCSWAGVAGPAPARGAQADDAAILPEPKLQDALNDSIGRSRLLVVVTSPTREKERQNREIWSQPALREWVRWHGVLAHVKDRETLEVLRSAGMVIGLPDQPLLFKSGRLERIFGSNVREDTGAPAGVRLRNAPAQAARARVDDRPTRPDRAVRLLLRLEWTRGALARADEPWAAAHAQNNPEPDPPKVPYAFRNVSERADPALGDERAGGKPDPVGRWLKLLESGGEGDAAARVEMLTWLWERGPQHQPSFSASALSTLAREWHALGERAPDARTRAREIRDATSALLAWMGPEGWFEWLMLSRIADEHLEVVDLIDAALDDPDGRLMLAPAQRATWETTLPWLNWAAPAEIPGGEGDPLVPLVRLSEQVDGPGRKARNAGARSRLSEPERARLAEFEGWLLRVQAARLYAAFLGAGDEARAARVADVLKEAAGPDEAALWLTTAALCEGQPRQQQGAWLEGAQDPIGTRLLAHVRAELARPAPRK